MTCVFNSDNFTEINYLNFDPNFNIDIGDKIKIILGPNGTGKTSIYKNIKSRLKDFSYIDYDDVEKSIIAKKDKIVIGASVLELEKAKKKKQSIIDEINITDNLMVFDITSNPKAKSISNSLEKYRKFQETAILDFNNEKLSYLFELKDNMLSFFNMNAKQFVELGKIKTEVKDIVDNYKKHFLEEIESFLTDEETICPVCGSISEIPIKQIVSEKISKIKNIDDEIISRYQQMFPEAKADEIIQSVNMIKDIIDTNNIKIDNLEKYYLCGGNEEIAKKIVDSQSAIKELNESIKEMEQQKEKFYDNLKSNKEMVKSLFELQFDNALITFDDSNQLVEIKLKRKIETYSTGEINLMTFIICILEFISSDKELVIIDDPLSSYDIPNQYRIMYEIATMKDKSKNVLIFTHNIDTINIANTQYNAIFEYEVMEKIKKSLFLNKINGYSRNNIIDIEQIINSLDSNYPLIGYLKLLSKKDTWNGSSKNHLIFHYDYPFTKTIDGITYSNDALVGLIDNFNVNSFNNISYQENTANKIIYMSALRVWIEKQFYLNDTSDTSIYGKMLGEKIKYIFEGNRWKGSNNVSKEYLMSKKVMLNNHLHSQSQKLPFYYVLSLSYNDILDEIDDIMSHFIK